MRRRRRTAAGAALTGLLALSCAAPAWSADTRPAEGNGFVPGGQKVDLSVASGEGTRLSPRLYSSTLPVDETSRYATLHRGDGERMEVSVVGSATWKNNAWSVGSGAQRLSLALTTEEGETTWGSSYGSVSGSTTPGRLTTSVAPERRPSLRAATTSAPPFPGVACSSACTSDGVQQTSVGWKVPKNGAAYKPKQDLIALDAGLQPRDDTGHLIGLAVRHGVSLRVGFERR